MAVTINGSTGVQLDDNDKQEFGTGDDLSIFHDGSHSNIKHDGTGDLKIDSDVIKIRATNNEAYIKCQNDAVELHYNDNKKFETTSGGASVTGHLLPGAADTYDLGANTTPWRNIWMENDLYIEDNGKAVFGTGEDLSIYHDGSDTRIVNNTGDFQFQADTLLLKNKAGGETYFRAVNNGSAEIYYDNSKKFETVSLGTKTTGYSKSFLVEGDSAFASTEAHVIQSNNNNQVALVLEHSGDNDPYGIVISFSDSTKDNNSHYFLKCEDSSNTNRLFIYSDGDVVNHDNSYGSTSDIKLKENIVDAGSQWNDIKAVKVRNFNFKSDTPSDKRLGVIAQELETVSPGLVSTNPDLDKDNNDLGTTTKSVKYSILYMKAIKALQEAMAKIETLETKVAALEAHTHE